MNKLFSSFSQTKALLWKEQIDAILSGKLKAPIGAIIDLTNKCNLGCYWCNAKFYRDDSTLDIHHVMEVIDMLSAWKVKSVCYAGGGEPSMHPGFDLAVDYAARNGLEVGISTNGILLNNLTIQSIGNYARFCGFSVDAGTVQTWSAVKCTNLKNWSRMLENAKELSKYDSLDLTYKFMIIPENQHEIFVACKLARRNGFDNFYCRIPAFENVPGVSSIVGYDSNLINSQIRKALKYDSEKFKVYANLARAIDFKFQKRLAFKQCKATPLAAVFCADGWCYPCIDLRSRLEYRMCKHLDLIDYWGSQKHLKMLESIDISRCPRCAFSHYNEAIEAYENDYMFKYFP